MKLKIEINPQFEKALDLIENTNKNVFITGRAGTGKSTLLSYWRKITKKKSVVLAPTGVAALNVKGQTIHSFFRFKPGITLDKVKKAYGKRKEIYQKINSIVIDEISMVRSDLLDCVDKFMRLNGNNKNLSFGGAQMIFIGDLYQIPPVVTGKEREIFRTLYKSQYFFDSKVFASLKMEFIELEKVYRQHDQNFIDLLNVIRNNSADEKHLLAINKRFDPDFDPDLKDFFICLTTTNKLAEEINQKQLAKLKNKIHTYHGEILGDFSLRSLPTKIKLLVKIDSQIMMLNNDKNGKWVNGSVGKIINIKPQRNKDDIVIAQLTNGSKVKVSPFTWELFKFSIDEKTGKLISETVGSFTQYPFMLAWAVTIHKAQGKTFDNVVIDIGKGTFCHGQMYVALSRCTTLSGLILKKPIEKKHIFMDWRVVKFLTQYQYQISENKLSLDKKIKIIEQAIENKSRLKIIYLKANDEKSKRIIEPNFVGEMEYLSKTYLGVSAFDSKRQEERNFKVERILEIIS